MSLYHVSWDHKVEASSPTEAAFLAYKHQKDQSTSSARYSVNSGSEIIQDVTIADAAPIELLTSRECEVAGLVMRGATNADIGRELEITPRTVKAHISHIFEKFHVENRVSLASKMFRIKKSQGTKEMTHAD